MIRYRISRLLETLDRWWWARLRERVWFQSTNADMLRQVVWRLDSGATTHDQRIARDIARKLLTRIDRKERK